MAKRPVNVAAVALTTATFGSLAAAALIDGVALGTIGEWMGGVGAAAALLVAIHEITFESATRREDLTREQEAQARRVWLHDGRYFVTSKALVGGRWSDVESSQYHYRLTNGSSDPIHAAYLMVAIKRTPFEKREEAVEVDLSDSEIEGRALNGSRRGHPMDCAFIEHWIGTLGPGNVAELQFFTKLRTMTEELTVVWNDVWSQQRWLAIDVNALLTYGQGETPSDFLYL